MSPRFRVSVKTLPGQNDVFMMNDTSMRSCVANLIKRAISAMCTTHALDALHETAKAWAKQWAPNQTDRLEEVESEFQKRLRQVLKRKGPGHWSLTVIDFCMPEKLDGTTHHHVDGSEFDLSAQMISLN